MAMHEALRHSRNDVVDYLLKVKGQEQLMTWYGPNLPLHTAAYYGNLEALRKIAPYYPNINVSAHRLGEDTAIRLAIREGHLAIVNFLLEHKARVYLASDDRPDLSPKDTLLHSVLESANGTYRAQILDTLLAVEGGRKYLESKDVWGETPLMLASALKSDESFMTLLNHGASIHTVSETRQSLVFFLEKYGRSDLLRHCGKDFTIEELEGREYHTTPLEEAQNEGYKEFAKLLKEYIRLARQSERSETGLLTKFRDGWGKWKGR